MLELLLRTDTGTFTTPDPFTEISDPPPDWLPVLPAVELLPEALPLPEPLLPTDTGTLTELGRVAEISDPGGSRGREAASADSRAAGRRRGEQGGNTAGISYSACLGHAIRQLYQQATT